MFISICKPIRGSRKRSKENNYIMIYTICGVSKRKDMKDLFAKNSKTLFKEINGHEER